MESTTKNKSSNIYKIRDIVRLHQILKKWKKLASSSKSTSCNPSHSSNTPTSTTSTSATATATPPLLLPSSSSKSCIDIHDDQPHEKPGATAAAASTIKTKSSIISRRPATKFLKKTLSFFSLDSSSSSRDHQVAVPKGYLAVLCVGREAAEEDQLGGEIYNMKKKRFVIPTSYLAHQAFSLLLQQAEEEFGFQQDGILKLPCDVPLFHNILNTIMNS